MWLGEDIEISVSRTGAVSYGLQICDYLTGQPINLTGFQHECVIAFAAGEEAAYTYGPYDPVDAAAGKLDISFGKMATASSIVGASSD